MYRVVIENTFQGIPVELRQVETSFRVQVTGEGDKYYALGWICGLKKSYSSIRSLLLGNVMCNHSLLPCGIGLHSPPDVLYNF